MKTTLSFAFACSLALALPQPTDAQQNTIGGGGGTAYRLDCPYGQYAVGISVRHDGNAVNRVNLRCVGVDEHGDWNGSPRWTGWSPTTRFEGNSGLTTRSHSCPQNEFVDLPVYGYTGNVAFAVVVTGFKVRCVRYSAPSATASTTQGSAQRTFGNYGRIGARFTGTEYYSGQSTGTSNGIWALDLKYGMALDSATVIERAMPWGSGAPVPLVQPSPARRMAPSVKKCYDRWGRVIPCS